jgi:hypothetical protein
MSGNTDSVHLSEVGHEKNGGPEIEYEDPTHIARQYDGWFDDLHTLGHEERRRLDGRVESPTIRWHAGLDESERSADDVVSQHSHTESGHEFEDESESADGCYGWFNDQPMVASRSDEQRAEMNASGRPADAVSEPDALSNGEYIYMGHDRLTDPTGNQLTGTASGLEEYIPTSSTTIPVQLGRKLEPVETLNPHTRRLRALKIISEDEQTPRDAEGVGTYDLEVLLPYGEVAFLRNVVPNPEDYSRSSIHGIECRLALDEELKKVSCGIDVDGHMTGVAALLDHHTNELARFRTEHDRMIPDRREQRVKQQVYDRAAPLRELGEKDPELREEVLAEARRLLDGNATHEIRRAPVEVASTLARRVLAGTDITTAFLSLVEEEQTNPRNVIRVNAILKANLASSKGYVTTQGVVKKVYYPPVPGMKFAMILKDGNRREDEVRVSVWESSEYEETASTADPDDVDGEVLLSKKTFIEPNEGDTVRLVDFKLPREKSKQTYQGQPKLDSRWASDIVILERAPVTSPDVRETPATPQRVGRSSRPSGDGEVAPRSAAANFSGEVTISWPEPATISTHIADELVRVAETVREKRAQKATRQAAIRTARNRRFLKEHPEAVPLSIANAMMRSVNGEASRDPSTCWVCGVRNDANMDYDPVLLAHFHSLCLARAGVENCREYTEQRLAEYTESLDGDAA